jgi:chromosome segregation ATPase
MHNLLFINQLLEERNMANKKRVIIAAVVAIAIGLVNGSCSSRESEKKEGDVKQLLNQVLLGVEKLERENRDLKNKLDYFKQSKISRDRESLRKELDKTTNENEKMKEEISSLKEQIDHAERQLETSEAQSARIADLETGKRELQEQVSKLKGLLSYTQLELESLKGRSAYISEMEQKNKELVMLLEKINAITRERKGEPAPQPAP